MKVTSNPLAGKNVFDCVFIRSVFNSLVARALTSLLIIALLAPLGTPLLAKDPARLNSAPAPGTVTGSLTIAIPTWLTGIATNVGESALSFLSEQGRWLATAQTSITQSILPAISLAFLSGAPIITSETLNPATPPKTDAGLATVSPATLSVAVPTDRMPFDFDGDDRADIAVWRPSSGAWLVFQSSTGTLVSHYLGTSSDRIVPADYDGDGKTDRAVWTPSNGNWNIVQSSNEQTVGKQWGAPDDIPVPADYDGDLKADIAVWRPSTGYWYIVKSSSSNGDWYNVQLGMQSLGDVPVAGDYDGDNLTDVAVWREPTGYWYVIQSTNQTASWLQWGQAGDTAVPADYDGDGKTDYAVWRPNGLANGTWYASTSGSGLKTAQLASICSQDVLVPANYDGDASADFAAWRPLSGMWTVWKSLIGAAVDIQPHGISSDIPIPAAFIKQRISTCPAGSGAATPSSVAAGGTTLLTVTVTPGTNPTSTGLTVTGNLADIGGSTSQTFYDDGTNGDAVAGNNVFSFSVTVASNTAVGGKSLPVSIADAQTRTANASIALNITANSTAPTATGSANPNQLASGTSTLLTVTVTPGTNPISTGLTVTGNLTAIGGSATQTFYDDGTNGDAVPGNNVFSFSTTVAANIAAGSKTLPINVIDAQSRTATTSIALTVTPTPPSGSPQLSKEYIYAGSQILAYEEFNITAQLFSAPPSFAVNFESLSDKNFLPSLNEPEKYAHSIINDSPAESPFAAIYQWLNFENLTKISTEKASFSEVHKVEESKAESNQAEAENRNFVSKTINETLPNAETNILTKTETSEKESLESALKNNTSAISSKTTAAGRMMSPPPPPRPILDEYQLPQIVSAQNNLGSPMGQTEASSTIRAVATLTRERAGIGNFGFNLPVASLPGRGMDASVGLSYNSQLWTKTVNENDETFFTYNVDGNQMAPGFQIGYGYLDYYPGGASTNQIILTELNGTRRQLKLNGSIYQSNDGSFIDATRNSTSAVVSYTDGTKVTYGPINSQRRHYPTKITDRHGNYILISYTTASSGKLSTVKDTLGREIKFHYDTTTEQLIAVTVPGFEGGTTRRQTIRFYYETIPLQWSGRFASADYVEAPPNITVLKHVYFPGTKTGYRYDYSQYYGMIHKINRLEGMQVTGGDSLTQMGAVTTIPGTFLEAASTCYNYQDSPCSVGNYLPIGDVPKYNLRIDDWVGRTGSAPQTQYSLTRNVDANGVGTSTMTVSMPDGTKNVSVSNIRPSTSPNIFNWEDGLVTETHLTSTGRTIPWARAVMKWQEGSTTLGRRNARIEHIKTTDEIGQTKATVFEYDNYNNRKLITEHDFAPEASIGTELSRTEITYETNSQWTGFSRLVHLPVSIKKKVNGIYVSRTDYKYDEYTPVNTPNVVQHDGSYNVSNPGYPCNCEWVCSVSRDEYGYCPGTEEYVCYDTCYTYNPQTAWRGNITKVIAFYNPDAADESGDPNASVTTLKYDIAGNTVEASLNCCNVKTWQYNVSNQYAYPISETRGEGVALTTSAEYNFPTGLVTRTIDENTQATDYEYETDTLRQKKVTYPNGGYTQTQYSDKLIGTPSQLVPGFVLTTTALEANKTSQSYNYFDARGLPTRTATLTPNGWSVSAVEFDSMGRPLRNYNPFYAAAANDEIPAGTKSTEVVNYDGLSRATQVKFQDASVVNSYYNEAAVIYSDPDSLSRTGTATRVTDQAGKEKRQIVDALGRAIRMDEPDNSGNLGTVTSPTQATHYYYDGNDNLSKSIQIEGTVRQTREFKYDALSRLTHERQVEATATLNNDGLMVGAGSGQWTKVLKYNTRNLLTEGIDARGVKTEFKEYDALNRIKKIEFSDGTPTVKYTYDQARAGSYNKGSLTRVETELVASTPPDTPTTATELDYDLMGRVVKHRQSINAQNYNQEYAYNLAGQLTSQTYPSGKVVTYGFDNNGRLASVADQSRTYLSGIGYVGKGNQVNSLVLGNGTAQGFAYNDRLQLERQTLTKPGVVVNQYDYLYGKLNPTTEQIEANSNNGQLAQVKSLIGTKAQWTQRFFYDSIGRLSESKEYSGSSTTTQSYYRQKFDYDRFGNLYRKQEQNTPAAGQPAALPYTPIEDADISKTTNRFTSGTIYDDAGNVTQDTKFRSLKFAYDANGRMIKTSNIDNTNQANSIYDASGQRVAVKANNTWKHFVYDAFGKMIAEYGGAATSAGVKYVFTDWQGSARTITDSAGAVKARMDYTAFGEEIAAGIGRRETTQGFGAAHSLNQKYALTERDTASGLDHTWWRKLENKAGRWTSPDPYNGSMKLGNPQSFNRYSYVNNQPTNYIDPSGLDFYYVSPPNLGPDMSAFWSLWLWSMSQNYGYFTVDGQRGGPSDCERFADIVEDIAKSAKNAADFANQMAKRFLDEDASISGLRRANERGGGESFGDSGFKKLFKGPGNQVRHFTGGLIAGYLVGATGGNLAMGFGEDAPEDIALNAVSTALGARIVAPTPATTKEVSGGYRSEMRRTVNVPANPGYTDLAERIRKQVCE